MGLRHLGEMPLRDLYPCDRLSIDLNATCLDDVKGGHVSQQVIHLSLLDPAAASFRSLLSSSDRPKITPGLTPYSPRLPLSPVSFSKIRLALHF